MEDLCLDKTAYLLGLTVRNHNKLQSIILQSNISKSESPSLMKFNVNVVFKKIFDPYFFLSAMADVEGVKTTLEVEGAKHILLNILEIIEDITFMYIDEICVFLTTNLMADTVLQKNLLFKLV